MKDVRFTKVYDGYTVFKLKSFIYNGKKTNGWCLIGHVENKSDFFIND